MSEQPVEFLKLFFAQERDLRAFIGSLVRAGQARDDVFQETALSLWQSFAEFFRAGLDWGSESGSEGV